MKKKDNLNKRFITSTLFDMFDCGYCMFGILGMDLGYTDEEEITEEVLDDIIESLDEDELFEMHCYLMSGAAGCWNPNNGLHVREMSV